MNAIAIVFASLASLGAPSPPMFTEREPGFFAFDTGAIRGVVRADGKSEGIVELADLASGAQLANPRLPGIFSLYRLFSAGKRFPDARTAPHRAQVIDEGAALRVVWPASEAHPAAIEGTFRVAEPRSIDLDLVATPASPLPSYEIFVSSYPAMEYRHFLFLKPTFHAGGGERPALFEPVAAPFFEGCYLAFPRDIESSRLLFDGRWQRDPNPVHFALGRHYALPLVGSRHPETKLALVLFARRDDCFAMETTYARPGDPDSVSDHNSLYLSLGGTGLVPEKPVTFRLRA